MSELDKIAREDMTYGAMRQYGTVEVTEAPGLGLLEWVDTGPIIGMKALAGLVGKGGKGKSVSDYLGRIFKRARMEEQGKNILFEKFEGGESPRAIARKFYDEVYPNLNPDAQDKFKQWSQTGEHYPGATKEGKSIDVPFSEQVDDYIGETFPSMGALERGEDIIYDFIEGFGDNASSRGELVYMSILNDRYDEFIKTSGKGLSKLQQTAKKIFGTTDDATEAGYILEDGSMLDFSGKAEGGTRGMRAYDHRQINQVGDSGVGGLDEFDDVGMFEFITHGGIRWTPEMNAIEIGSKPSEGQINSLKKVYQDMRNRHNKFQTKYAQGGSTFTVEATMPSNQERFYGVILDENRLYKEYDFTAPWETVERDIRQFYKTGKGPSITQQFHR
jgi:hypothetical protein